MPEDTASPEVHDSPTTALSPERLYDILRLRSEVFVTEQECVYLDLDGLDLLATTRQIWIEAPDGSTWASARILDLGTERSIGRIVTAPAARQRGLGGVIVQHALDHSHGPWMLNAQAHLAGWYGRFGFVAVGEVFDEHGIDHVRMERTHN
jgi:ElaA protein